MQAVLVSHNRKKIAELRAILGQDAPGLTLLSAVEAGLPTIFPRTAAVLPKTPHQGAGRCQARVYRHCRRLRSGGRCPRRCAGVYSARYAGEHGDDDANNAKLLRELAARPTAPRTAAFVCAMACVFPDGESFICEGRCPGEILEEARGAGGFGYDPLFFYAPAGKSFAELDGEEKNRISHRARALAAFAPELAARMAARCN